MAQIVLDNVILKHDIPVTTKWGTTHVLIFYDPKTNLTWAWKTTTLPAFTVHCTYSIMGRDEGNYNLSHVTQISYDRSSEGEVMKSEQPDGSRDAWDVLFNDTNLTFNEMCDIIPKERRNV